MGRVDYQIGTPHSQKKRQIFYVNLLEKWKPPNAVSYVAFEDGEEEEDFIEWRGSEEPQPQPILGEQLTESQRKELGGVLDEFDDILREKPGQTQAAEHSINTNNYSTGTVQNSSGLEGGGGGGGGGRKELKEMEVSGVIELSHSEWGSPIIIVRKKHGSLRMCVDFRKLNAVTPIDAYPMPRTDELLVD